MKDNKDEEKTLFQAIDAVDDKFLMETLKDMEKRKICMVTGATSGIGEACALRFAKEGYDVIITGRRDHLLQALAKRIEALGVRAKTLCFDVRDQQQVFDVCGSLEADWAEIDVLINNAGLALGLDPLQDGDLDDWNTMVDTNI